MIHFVAPPGWPSGPAGWLPPTDWTPGPGMPEPPRGWVFYVDDYGMPADPGPYHWDPDGWTAAQKAYRLLFKPTGDEAFPAYTPPRHRSISRAILPNRVEAEPVMTRRRHPFRVVLAVAVLALVAVLILRPGVLDALKDAVTPTNPSAAAPTSDTLTRLPAPNDLIAAAMTSLGHQCITESLEPHLIGCARSGGDDRVVVRWVLDADDEAVTFQVLGRATNPGSPASTSLAALLQLATGDPRVDIIMTLSGLDKREEREVELDWGSVHLADLGTDGLQLIQGVRADGPPPTMAVKQFELSATEAETVLPADGDFDCASEGVRLTCTRGDGEVAVLSDEDTITALYIGIGHIDDTKGPLLNLVLAEDDILAVIDTVLEVADSEDGTAISVAGYLVERMGDQVRIIRILPWW